MSELRASQYETLEEIKKNRHMSMEEIDKLFRETFGGSEDENVKTDRSWIWWAIGALIIVYYLLSRH